MIQFWRNTAAAAAAHNRILADGQPGVERDTGRMKIGDGVTAWNDLRYQDSPAGLGDLVWWGRYNTPLTVPGGEWVSAVGYEDDFVNNYPLVAGDETSPGSLVFDPITGIFTFPAAGVYTVETLLYYDAPPADGDLQILVRMTPQSLILEGANNLAPVLLVAGVAAQTTFQFTDRFRAGTTAQLQFIHGLVVDGRYADLVVLYFELYVRRIA